MTAMGGAVYAAAAAALSGCTFANNTAIEGGAVALTDTSTVDKCTFAGNVGASNGSAVCMYAPAAAVSIANSVFTDNISGQVSVAQYAHCFIVHPGCDAFCRSSSRMTLRRQADSPSKVAHAAVHAANAFIMESLCSSRKAALSAQPVIAVLY
jgi:hypothetical protein